MSSLTVTFWCSGCMRQASRTFRDPLPQHLNAFGMLCAGCTERELTRPLSQADGTAGDSDEWGDDSGPLVSV